MTESVEQLRIYKSARNLEDQIYELVKALPPEQFYGLGNNLRRSSAAVSHYIMEAHRLFSYRLKLDALAAARREAEATQHHLKTIENHTTHTMIDEYTGIIKQSWGLTRWVKTRLEERQGKAEIAAKEEMAQAG